MKTSIIFYSLMFCSCVLFGQDNLANHFIGISNTPINDIVIESNKSILVATEQGLYRIKDFNIDAELITQQATNKLSIDEDEHTWSGLYANKIMSLKKGEVFSTGISDNNMITAMLVVGKKIWIGTNNGLFEMSLKQMKEMPHFRMENSKLLSNQIMDLEIDAKGRIWIATDRGISIYDGSRWEQQLEGKQVSAMVRDGNNMWVAADKMIQRYGKDLKWRAVVMPLNYTGHVIRDLKFDYNNDLWVATNHVLKYDTDQGVFSVYDRNTGFNSSMSLCLAVDSDNQVWVGTAGNGLYRINNALLEEPMAMNNPVKGFVTTKDKENEVEKETMVAVNEVTKPKKTSRPKKERTRKRFNNNPTMSAGTTAKGGDSEKVNQPKRSNSVLPNKANRKEKSNINFLGNRLIKEGVDLDVTTMTLEIAIWDGQSMDGDTVSLYYNGECILKNFSLTKERQYFTLDINPRITNHLVLYAHSQGVLGYTTATIAIEGQDSPKEWVVLNSDTKKCDKIAFKFVY